MATVRKREWTYKGVTKTAWAVRYTDGAGKRRLVTCVSKKDADRKRLEIETEVVGGTHTAARETITFREGAREFMLDCQRRQRLGDITKAGVRSYRYRIEHYATPILGHRRIADLRSTELQEFVEGLRERLAPRTVLGVYQGVFALLTFATRHRWVRRNVLRDEPIKLPKAKKRADIPTKADIVALLHAAEVMQGGENLVTFLNRRAVVSLGIFGGLRPGESFGLQWEDLDFAKSVIHVRHSHSQTDGLKGPKSEAGLREVPLTPPIYRALSDVALYWTIRDRMWGPGFRSYDQKAANDRIRNAWDKRHVAPLNIPPRTGFVILGRYGTPMFSQACVNFWRTLMKQAGLYDAERKRNRFTMHALRHAAVSLLIEAGLPAMNLKTLIGHASSKTTYDVYGHLFPTDTRTTTTAEAIAANFDATRIATTPAI